MFLPQEWRHGQPHIPSSKSPSEERGGFTTFIAGQRASSPWAGGEAFAGEGYPFEGILEYVHGGGGWTRRPPLMSPSNIFPAQQGVAGQPRTGCTFKWLRGQEGMVQGPAFGKAGDICTVQRIVIEQGTAPPSLWAVSQLVVGERRICFTISSLAFFFSF